MEQGQRRPGNYLSLDGGTTWLSALPALITLDEIMKRLQRDLESLEAPLPCKIFDMIIASGSASLVALLVGKLDLTPAQATKAYKKLEPALSVGPTEDKEERERNMEAFKKAFTGVLEEHGFNEHSLMQSKEQDESDAKIVICTQNAANPPSNYPIRSYPVRGARVAPCTILQAACASIASPDRFQPVIVGSGYRKVTLIDAMISRANPTKVLLSEAQRVFGEDGNVAAIVSIGTGRSMQDGLASTNFGLPMDTTDAITMNCEQVHEDVQTLLHNLFVYFRFNPKGGSDYTIDALSINARMAGYFQEEDTDKHLDNAVESMKARQKGGNLRDINVVEKYEIALRPRPSVAPNFVGREDILESMRQTHFGERPTKTRMPATTVLSGLGGSGKTQIALKFALEYENKCPDAPVYLLNASSEDSLKADFETIIRSQGIAYRSQSCDDALAWLAARGRKWCLILDNADDPSVNLFPYIPKSAQGNVIITTRNSTHALLSPDEHYAVEGLPMADAVMLILKMANQKSTEDNKALAQAIVKELGSLPLALAHAGAYIFVHQCLSTYLEIYRTSRAQFLASNQALPHDYQLSVATTVQMSLDKLSEATREMMYILSRLDISSIALQIISTSAERRFRTIDGQYEFESLDPQTVQQADVLMKIFCPDGEWFEYDFNTSIQQCLEYSLLQIATREEERFYSMHVLVQTYLQCSVDNIKHHQPEQLVIRLLGSAITLDNDHKYHAINRLLAPHIRLISVNNVMEPGDFSGFGQVLGEQGSLQLSVEHLEWSLGLRMSVWDEYHPLTLAAMSNLAGAYGAFGRPQEAVELEEKVLIMGKRLYGAEDPMTLLGMKNLATTYSDLGRYNEALKLREKVLDVRKPALGEEDHSTLGAMSDLASSYAHLGRYQEALSLLERVLELRKRISGDEDLGTLSAMGNLASIQAALGRHMEALELKTQVLKSRKHILGVEHPDTLLAMGNLAGTYSDMGRHVEASELSIQMLELSKRIAGEEHSSTLLAMNNLAINYYDLGRYREALELQETVLKLRRHISGDEHPKTMTAMGNLASTFQALGNTSEALELMEQVVRLRRHISGEEHPETLCAMGNLAAVYTAVGRNQEGLELGEKVLEMRKRISGDEHPETMSVMNNLASAYDHLGRHREALELRQKVLELRQRILGDEHPLTISIMGNVATSLRELGKIWEALKLSETVLQLRLRISGNEHPGTLYAMGNLAAVYTTVGRYREGSELGEKVLEMRKRISGEEHPETMSVMSNLGMAYGHLGMHREALELEEKVLELRKHRFGDEHPDTMRIMINLVATYCDLGRYQEAVILGEKALGLVERILGDKHLVTANAMENLAQAYDSLERDREALALQEKAVEMYTRLLGEENADTLQATRKLSVILYNSKFYEEANALLQAALPLYERIYGGDHIRTFEARKTLEQISNIPLHHRMTSRIFGIRSRSSARGGRMGSIQSHVLRLKHVLSKPPSSFNP